MATAQKFTTTVEGRYLVGVTSSKTRHHLDLVGTRPAVYVGVGY